MPGNYPDEQRTGIPTQLVKPLRFPPIGTSGVDLPQCCSVRFVAASDRRPGAIPLRPPARLEPEAPKPPALGFGEADFG